MLLIWWQRTRKTRLNRSQTTFLWTLGLELFGISLGGAKGGGWGLVKSSRPKVHRKIIYERFNLIFRVHWHQINRFRPFICVICPKREEVMIEFRGVLLENISLYTLWLATLYFGPFSVKFFKILLKTVFYHFFNISYRKKNFLGEFN